jgi:hypothetical protein
MAIKDELVEVDALDLAFAKRAEDLWDIVATSFNKRIEITNVLGADLLKTLRDEFRNQNKWEVKSEVGVLESFPSAKRREEKVSSFPSGDGIGFYSNAYVERQSKGKKPSAAVFTAGTELKGVVWYGGQFNGYENEDLEEFFDFKFYDKLRGAITLPKKDASYVDVAFPGTESEWDGEKRILMELDWKSVRNKQVILQYHNLFKIKVMAPMLLHLRKQ